MKPQVIFGCLFIIYTLLICNNPAIGQNLIENNRAKRSTAVAWDGKNWAFGCDWTNQDLGNVKVPGDQCGGKCAATSGCTHFTWTNHEGGTCWMKSGSVTPNDAVVTGDNGVVCGYVQSSPGNGGSVVGTSYSGVLTTRHPATETGACQLPETSYASGIHPVALGNIDSLGNLKFQSGLCGHILRLDCGHGSVDIIVSNANLGGGLDLYASSWDLATGNKPPGQEYCNVQLTDRNALSGSNDPVCYYSPESEKYNDYYHLLGLFNTGSRIVSRGTLDGREGQFNSITSYIAFNGGPISQDANLIFYFTDESSLSFRLRDCVREDKLHIWS